VLLLLQVTHSCHICRAQHVRAPCQAAGCLGGTTICIWCAQPLELHHDDICCIELLEGTLSSQVLAECPGEGAGCFCRCTRKHYDYVFGQLPSPVVERFCRGFCPTCLGICACSVSGWVLLHVLQLLCGASCKVCCRSDVGPCSPGSSATDVVRAALRRRTFGRRRPAQSRCSRPLSSVSTAATCCAAVPRWLSEYLLTSSQRWACHLMPLDSCARLCTVASYCSAADFDACAGACHALPYGWGPSHNSAVTTCRCGRAGNLRQAGGMWLWTSQSGKAS